MDNKHLLDFTFKYTIRNRYLMLLVILQYLWCFVCICTLADRHLKEVKVFGKNSRMCLCDKWQGLWLEDVRFISCAIWICLWLVSVNFVLIFFSLLFVIVLFSLWFCMELWLVSFVRSFFFKKKYSHSYTGMFRSPKFLILEQAAIMRTLT